MRRLSVSVLLSLVSVTASKLGIYRAGHDQCMSGEELDAVSQNLMSDVLDNVTVFYRTSPRHKSIIVKVR